MGRMAQFEFESLVSILHDVQLLFRFMFLLFDERILGSRVLLGLNGIGPDRPIGLILSSNP